MRFRIVDAFEDAAPRRCDIGCVDRAPGISGLALHKGQRVVSKRIIGTQANGLIELANGAVVRVRRRFGSG